MFRKYSEPEIFKISVSERSTNNVSYAVIESFNKAVCDPLNKIVQNFIPPIFQRTDKPQKKQIVCHLSFVYPSFQELRGLVPTSYFFKNTPEFFFEKIQFSQFRVAGKQLGQTRLFFGGKFFSVFYKDPAHSF